MSAVRPISVSIVTVCHNAAGCIEQCLRSVAGQAYQHVEYIVVDGGSTDGTLDVIRRYRDRIAVLVSEPDRGIYCAMNKGIVRATGDLIYFLNADDYLIDERVIADVADVVASHPRGDVYYGSIELRDASGRIGVYEPEGPEKAAETMVCGCLPHQATFARRQVFERTGLLNEAYRYHADYDWFLKVIADPNIELARFGRVVASYRLGGASARLAKGQPEAYRIQNASPLYRSPEWSQRRIAILQENLLAARIENADLRVQLQGQAEGLKHPRCAARAAAVRRAVASRFARARPLLAGVLRALRARAKFKNALRER